MNITFNVAADKWKQKIRHSELSPKTIKMYEDITEKKLLPRFGGYKVPEISRQDAEKIIIDYQKKSVCKPYLKTIWRVMLSILNDAGDKNLKWDFPKHYGNIQSQIEEAIQENDEMVLMLILLREKITVLKLLALRACDVDENSSKITIRNTMKIKGDKFEIVELDNVETIKISMKSMKLLKTEINKRSLLLKDKPLDLIFTNIDGKIYTPSYYFNKFQELSKLVNFNITPKFLTEFEYIENETEIKSPYLEKVKKNKLSFDEYCKQEIENIKNLSDDDRKKMNLIFEKHLKEFCSKFNVNDIDDEFKLKLIEYLRNKRCKLSTREYITGFLRQICDVAVQRNFIRYNPFINVYLEADPMVKYHSLSNEEISKIMKLDSNDIYNAFLQIKLLTATRTSETLGLSWNDILPNNGQIIIRHQLKEKNKPVLIQATKNYRSRKIIPPSITFDILEKIKPITLFNEKNILKLVFCNEDGSPLNSKILHQKLRALTGRNNVRLHDLRVTAITVFYKTTKNLTLTSKQAGHLDSNVTVRHYVDVVPDLSIAKLAQDKYYKEMK